MKGLNEEIRKEVDDLVKLYDDEAFSNITDIIENITFLFSLKEIDLKEKEKELSASILGTEYTPFFYEDSNENNDEGKFRWSRFKNKYPEDIDKILQDIRKIYTNKSSEEYKVYLDYIRDTNLIKFDNLAILTNVIEKVEKIFNRYRNNVGEIYDYLLIQIPPNQALGQFITPRHIVDFILKLVKPSIEDKIVDLCCGTGAFLVYSQRYILDNYKNELLKEESLEHYKNKLFTGYEGDKKLSKFAKMNMCFNNFDSPNIQRKNSLDNYNDLSEKYTLAISNIPFSGKENDDKISSNLFKETKSKNKQLLFINQLIDCLQLGGRCAVIVSDGFLFNETKAYIRARKRIVDENKLEAIISMPSGIFKIKNKSGKKSGVSTAIMIFTKTGNGGSDNVWFYDMKADGYSLDDNRNKIDDNDIDDIIHRFNNLSTELNRDRKEKSFFVDASEIIKNKYTLSINSYKVIKHGEIVYDKPKNIFNKIKNIDDEIRRGLDELERMIEV